MCAVVSDYVVSFAPYPVFTVKGLVVEDGVEAGSGTQKLERMLHNAGGLVVA